MRHLRVIKQSYHDLVGVGELRKINILELYWKSHMRIKYNLKHTQTHICDLC